MTMVDERNNLILRYTLQIVCSTSILGRKERTGFILLSHGNLLVRPEIQVSTFLKTQELAPEGCIWTCFVIMNLGKCLWNFS